VITSAPMGRQPQISPVAGGYTTHGHKGGIR
jgi:hypothetical protein